MSECFETILLIEDDPDYRALFSALLRSAVTGGVQIVCAEQLEMGLRHLDERLPDVIVTDLNLPDSSGLETVTRIQQRAPTAPIVVLSGVDQEELAIKALQCGAQDYLCKSRLVDGELLRRSLRYAVERKRANICLRKQRDFAEGLIESANAIILLVDTQSQILRMNAFAARTTGIDTHAVLGDDWREVFLPEAERPIMNEFTDTIVDSKTTHFSSGEVATRSGERLNVHWAGRAIRNDEGHIEYVLLTGHDVTELEQAQQRTLQAERLATIGHTMIGLAHESRNALQRSQACLSLLERVTRDIPPAIDYIARLQRAQDDLRCIHDDLRDYAQPLRLKLERGNLRDIVACAWSDLEEVREGRDVVLETEDCGCDLVCHMDCFRMQQVFRNLFENSLSACPGPVNISVRWSVVCLDGLPAIETAVHDNGPGFTAEQADRAFEVFFTSKSNGTGLGLPIANRIVEAHGGKMRPATDGSDGATILITLPRRRRR